MQFVQVWGEGLVVQGWFRAKEMQVFSSGSDITPPITFGIGIPMLFIVLLSMFRDWVIKHLH